MKGLAAIVIIAFWLGPSEALPDLLAPFRNMFGMNKHNQQMHNYHSSSGPKPSASGYGKEPSNFYKGFGGGPQSSPSGLGDDAFPPNFSLGGGGPEGPSPFGGSGSPFGSHPGKNFHPSSAPHRAPSSNSPSSRPGGVTRQVRQQPGQGSPYGRPPPSYRPNYAAAAPQQQGNIRGPPQGPAGDAIEDEQSYVRGPPPPGFQAEAPPAGYQNLPNRPQQQHSPQQQQHSPQQGGRFQGAGPPHGGGGRPQRRPSYNQESSPSYDYPRSNPNFQEGGPAPFSGGPSFAPEGDDDGPPRGFGGFGSFPQGNPGENSPPRGYGPSRPLRHGPRVGPFKPSRPSGQEPEIEGSPVSPQYSNGGQGGFYPGGNEYTEDYQGGPQQDGREPQIITADDVNKYPAQIEDTDEGPSYDGPAGPGTPQSTSSRPAYMPAGSAYLSASNEDYQPTRQRYNSNSDNGYSFSRPVSAGYQASAESVHYGKPMMMSASGSKARGTKLRPRSRSHGKRSTNKQKQKPEIVELYSPKDPSYRGMRLSASNVKPVTLDPDTAATGHHIGHGDEGLSQNGDRILYHVAGHQGPYSYRFGYDTGKGSHNRLFRFEEKDGKGYVKGKYGFYDKHGKLNLINYEAHPEHGYHAERGHSHGGY